MLNLLKKHINQKFYLIKKMEVIKNYSSIYFIDQCQENKNDKNLYELMGFETTKNAVINKDLGFMPYFFMIFWFYWLVLVVLRLPKFLKYLFHRR